jgi:hypothetical protein
MNGPGEPARRWPRAMATPLSRTETTVWVVVGTAFVVFLLLTIGPVFSAVWFVGGEY